MSREDDRSFSHLIMIIRQVSLLVLLLGLGACASVPQTVVTERGATVGTTPDTVAVARDTSIVAETEAEVPAPVQRPRPGSPRVVEITGPETVAAGDMATFRVRLAPGAVLPVHYRWDYGGGTAAIGNTFSASFDEAGIYWLQVATRNQVGRDTATVRVEVTPRPAPVTVAPPEEDVAAPQEGAPVTGYGWVVASGLGPDAAEATASVYREAGYPVSIHRHASENRRTERFVAVGSFRSEEEALGERARIAGISGERLWLVLRPAAPSRRR